MRISVDTPTDSSAAYPVEEVDFHKIWFVGLLAILASVVANLLVRAVGLALIDVPADSIPLQGPGSVILFTVIQVLAAVIVFAIVARFIRRPYRTFTLIAWVALLKSMHVVTFAITLGMLTRLTRAA